MKTRLMKHYFFVLSFLLLGCTGYIDAAVIWQGNNTADVINDDLILDGSSGDIIFDETTTGTDCEVVIEATSTDVNVTLQNGNPIVVRAGNAQAQLTIRGSSHTVTFNVDTSDLTFEGSPTGAKLLIHIEPLDSNFTVNFVLSGGRTVSFTSDANGGGTEVWLELNQGLVTELSTLSFTRNATDQNQNVNIEVGPKSLLSYVGQDFGFGAGFGRILFDPSNPDVGRMVLTVENSGAVIVSPRTFTEEYCYLDDQNIVVDRTDLAAGTATLEIINNDTQSSLLVVNKNCLYPELLVDPFYNLNAHSGDYKGTFTGVQWGFVLGANGELTVGDNAFLDYVGTKTDLCPTVTFVPSMTLDACADCGDVFVIDPIMLLKSRNPSALIVDGSNDPQATAAQINLGQKSALFFRSGVDCQGVVENFDGYQFTIDPANEAHGAGEIVFDVEGLLNVRGSNNGDTLLSKIEILSLYVNFTGGPLFYNGTETIFPLRTFATDTDGAFRQYNKAAFLINNRLNLFDTALVHTDQIHDVYENNSVQSEPTYIGGESFTLENNVPRPKIAFYDSRFLVHTSVALAGVDLSVPNGESCADNLSKFTFFYNGKRVDNGTGRYMILGTQDGSTACDGCTIISRDAHLDVIQDQTCDSSVEQLLKLDVAANTTVINNAINPAEDITGQNSIQTIFLGFNSNISIGKEPPLTFDINNTAELRICGNFFSFETQGGSAGAPEYSGVTGEGGIFVDCYGKISIAEQYRANMATMVTKNSNCDPISANGVVDLPKNQVLFSCRIGISDWHLDMSVNDVIIAPDQCISDYTLYWIDVKQDYDTFCPYIVENVNSCTCPPVVEMNVSSIPTILGSVQQLQIKDSRFGDPAHIKIGNEGIVGELVFLNSNKSAVESTAIVVVEDDGRIGLGSKHRNPDSLDASFVLGVNGVTLIANGDGKVVLNEDMIINNVCAILRGPDFNTGYDQGILRITSDCCRTLYVTKTGTLDLRSFQTGDTVQIEGNVQIVLESGARILLNGVELKFADEACMTTEKYDLIFSAFQNATDLHSTDGFRVSLIGTGTISLTDCSCFFVQEDSFVGVETLFEEKETETCQIPTTDITIIVEDSAQFIIGTDCEEEAGAFQVGNVEDYAGHTVRFNLTMAGEDAIFRNRKGGFLGLAVGIVQKNANSTANSWEVDNTFNVASITINVIDGLFAHDRIYSGDNLEAALLAIGDDGSTLYNFLYEQADTEQEFRAANASVHGGGNMVRITSGGGPVNPVVLDVDNEAGRVRTGILASRPLLAATNEAVLVDGDTLFSDIKTLDTNAVNRCTDYGNFAQGVQAFREGHTGIRVDYILGTEIVRFDAFDFFGPGTQEPKRQRAIDLGAAYIRVQNPNSPTESTFASPIPS